MRIASQNSGHRVGSTVPAGAISTSTSDEMSMVETGDRTRLDALLLSDGNFRRDPANRGRDQRDEHPFEARRDPGARKHDDRSHLVEVGPPNLAVTEAPHRRAERAPARALPSEPRRRRGAEVLPQPHRSGLDRSRTGGHQGLAIPPSLRVRRSTLGAHGR